MPIINIPENGHTGPGPNSGWQWLPYTDPAYLHTLSRAFRIIDSRIKGHRPCDEAFKALPRGRTFAQVWTDLNIWISYDPKNDGQNYGATDTVGGNEITITRFALRMGHWTTAATLVHELAHTNGAPSGASHAAEATLSTCLLHALEDPNILGSVIRASKFGGRLA